MANLGWLEIETIEMSFDDDTLPTTSEFFGMPLTQRMDWLEEQSNGLVKWHGNPIENLLVAVLIHDEHPVVRHEAAFLLGKMYSHGRIEGKCARATLCSIACDDLSIVVRHECAEALAAFDGAEVEEVLQRLMRDGDADVAATAALSCERLERRIDDSHSRRGVGPLKRQGGG